MGNVLILVIGLMLNLSAAFAESVGDLSIDCAFMKGDHTVSFSGQAFPFTLRKYELKITFPENSAGLTFYTDFDYQYVTETIDPESLTNSYEQYLVVPGMTVIDCNALPKRCLDSVNNDLSYFMIAKRNLLPTVSEADRAALQCGIDRIRLFNRKVRNLLQQRNIQ